jgi:cobalt-zinc-cadmium efflux system protein
MTLSDHQHDHDHHDHHDHHSEHTHAGAHVHAPANFGMAFAVGIALNTAFVIIETIFGLASNSMALVADAGHNLSDVLGLVVAWAAVGLSKKAPTTRYTYALRGSSILAALFNGVFLLVTVGAIGWEAVQRLIHPEPVASVTVMIVAAAGIVVNGISAWLFASGRKGDLNIRGAYLHMLADAAVSVGVVIAAFLVNLTGWLWLDAATSLVIVAVIVRGTWSLLRESIDMSLNAVPEGVDAARVRDYLCSRAGVAELHDLHIWPISTTETCLTAHLVMPAGHPGDVFLMEVARQLKTDFGINHTTLQVETDPASPCVLAPDHVV